MDRHSEHNQDEISDAQTDAQTDPQTDPQFDALMDRALAPQKPPADLARRIVEATVGDLPQGHRHSVLARISPWLRAAAAVLVLAAWTGIFMTGGEIFKDARALVKLDRIEQRIDAEMPLLKTDAGEPIEVASDEQSTDELLDVLTAIREELVIDQETNQF